MNSPKPVTIYTTRICPFCLRAKTLLNNKNIPFEEISLEGQDDLRQKLSQQYSWRTVPMILINGEFIGGYDDLKELDDSGELDEKIKKGTS